MERNTAQFVLTAGFTLESFFWVLAIICHCRIRATPRRRQRIINLPHEAVNAQVNMWTTAMEDAGARADASRKEPHAYTLSGVAFTLTTHDRQAGQSVRMEADFSPLVRRYDRLLGLLNVYLAAPTIMILSLVLCLSVLPVESNVPRAYAFHIFHAVHVLWPSFIAVALFRRHMSRACNILEGLPELSPGNPE
ncbi:MAG: hypothetical protein HN742_24130 [Lentisphaerae bacterium]|jgi:hypothetical protein|nr:hypothetical protein [Lentisphaerota bacterium]MBT4815105.1 hypothetical protein [Lentisphaerota bacterium]MBT5611560.1 hypothetical protein [Lentisphaerota bacterium]MBT7059587.1 hypothetical protein [Lentisphaerota bacterium]MBT7844987.1 hypothetical protein [Lentisphaerota bacterium]